MGIRGLGGGLPSGGGAVSPAREPFEVPPLWLPSFKCGLPPWSPFFICHTCHVASILHDTLNKQTICPIGPSPRALFFTSSLSAICHLLLNLSHLIIPSPLHRTALQPAFELSYLEGFLLSLPSFDCVALRLTDGCAIGVRARSAENIKSEAEPGGVCLSQSHHLPRRCGLRWLTSPCPSQPFDYVYDSCLMVGEQQLDLVCQSRPNRRNGLSSAPVLVLQSASGSFPSFCLRDYCSMHALRSQRDAAPTSYILKPPKGNQ